MDEPTEWTITTSMQPNPEDYLFDLEEALLSVVSLRAEIPSDAFTAPILGTERGGNGIVIDENGLVLTIGYLITEAETIWLLGNTGIAAPAHVVAYDQETGLGLVQALDRLNLPALEFGDSTELDVGDLAIVAGSGGLEQAITVEISAKHEFAGYWEYVLDEALFSAPPHPNWGGSALIGEDGKLYGVGSLFVQQSGPDDDQIDGNMIVPINVVKPILNELLTLGRQNKPPRPWLGMYAAEAEGRLVVVGLADKGPAQAAGVEPGDLVLGVAGQPSTNLVSMFRRVWSLGDAGVDIPLTLIRQGQIVDVTISSADRTTFLKAPQLH